MVDTDWQASTQHTPYARAASRNVASPVHGIAGREVVELVAVVAEQRQIRCVLLAHRIGEHCLEQGRLKHLRHHGVPAVARGLEQQHPRADVGRHHMGEVEPRPARAVASMPAYWRSISTMGAQ